MSNPGPLCRLLPLTIRDGALNMAIDEALLLSCTAGGPALTLRFYAWTRPTLSLGYFQPTSLPDDPVSAGLPVVRRLTGGGAIVHHAELTYSLVWRRPPSPSRGEGGGEGVAQRDPLIGIPRGVGESYACINEALAAGLRGLGLEPASPAAAGQPRRFLCFERRSRYDLVVDGQKVVGSAQRRCRTAVLQHGSILVGRSAARGIRDRSISELIGRAVPLEEAAEAVRRGFEEHLGWRLRPGGLSVGEGHLAEGLRHHKYNHLAWGGRRPHGGCPQRP